VFLRHSGKEDLRPVAARLAVVEGVAEAIEQPKVTVGTARVIAALPPDGLRTAGAPSDSSCRFDVRHTELDFPLEATRSGHQNPRRWLGVSGDHREAIAAMAFFRRPDRDFRPALFASATPHYGPSAPPTASQSSVPGVAGETQPCSNDSSVGSDQLETYSNLTYR